MLLEGKNLVKSDAKVHQERVVISGVTAQDNIQFMTCTSITKVKDI